MNTVKMPEDGGTYKVSW